MKIILRLLSLIGLLLTVVPSLMVFAGKIDMASHKNLMLMGTLTWFATAPFWIGRKSQ
jgi:hypothetical protein